MKTPRIKLPSGHLAQWRPDPLEAVMEADTAAPASTFVTTPEQPPSPAGRQRPADGQAGVMDVGRLAGQCVTILGAGSVGGYVARDLGPARPVINLVDYKSVLIKHTHEGRTIYQADQVGTKKVYAAKEQIERDYPGTVVRPFPYNVMELPALEIRRMAAGSLLMMLAIDDPVAMLHVNDLVYRQVELIQVAMHARAMSGHIVVCLPGVTPCLRCTLEITRPDDIHRLDAEPGSAWHIQRVAHEAATIAMEIMHAKVTGRPLTRWDLSKNLLYIANTREAMSPDGPGIHFEGSRKRPGCPICST